jgi:hypothetical protein
MSRSAHRLYWLRFFVIFLCHSGQIPVEDLDQVKISSFQILSKSSFISHPTPRCCRLQVVTDSFVKYRPPPPKRGAKSNGNPILLHTKGMQHAEPETQRRQGRKRILKMCPYVSFSSRLESTHFVVDLSNGHMSAVSRTIGRDSQSSTSISSLKLGLHVKWPQQQKDKIVLVLY